MKKKILQFGMTAIAVMIALLFGVTGMTKANPIDEKTAREVGMKFMNANTSVPLRNIGDMHLVTTYSINRGDAAFYIFNTPNGYVIVSADDCATPILGYSNEGQFDMENIPVQLQDYLQGFVEQIQYGIENHSEADEQTIQQWEMVRTSGRLNNNRTIQAVQPLITTTWGQDCYYNAMCPEDENGSCNHALTGCVATAMAQIMHYWEYPENGTGSHSYTPASHPEYGTLYADFGLTTYDWDNMPNSLRSSSSFGQINAVATLMYHCGVSVDMDYGPTSSGAWSVSVVGAFTNNFGYSNEMEWEGRGNYTDASWKAKLKDCLDLGRPVYYSGSTGSVGHAFVCDGYDMSDMFHFNWGWGGSSNGYFAIGAINVSSGFYYYQFNSGNNAYFNIHPQSDEPTNYVISVSANNVEGGTVSGGGTIVHGTRVTLSAVANDGYSFCYWEENGGVASTNPNYSFTANFNRNLVAVFAEPFTVTVSALEGGTVSGGGSYYYGESCTVTATPNEGYIFVNWTKNGEVVSSNINYTFVVTGESNMIAHFLSLEGNIDFANANVKAICVSNWDTNGDGELSYAEAAVVTSIGEVFRNNSGITSFKELQYFISLTSIGNNAFRGCSGLTSLAIPNSTTSIGENAFFGCGGLTFVHYTGNIAQWCNISFANAVSNPLNLAHNLYINDQLLTDLVIPETVTVIKQYAFYNATCLTSLTIPNSVTIIGTYAFYGCSNLTGSLTIPNAVTLIEAYTFYNCRGLTSLSIPNSVTSIDYYAFYGCRGLTGTLTIPNSVTSIGASAFSGCRSLTSVTIPCSVTMMGNNVFRSCTNLSSVIVLPLSAPTIGSDMFTTTHSDLIIYVPYESLNAYRIATRWSEYANKIQPMAFKTISAHGESNGWNFIASPLTTNTTPTNIDDMITETETDFDLYRFNQSTEMEWENWKSHANNDDHYHFNLVNGQGYLYANAEDVNLIFKGDFNEDETKDVDLVYDANADLPGWNLVGNPFPVSAYPNRSYYVMNDDGTAIEPVAVSMETAIPVCTGVMVKADAAGETVTFSKTAPDAAANQGVLQIALSQVVEPVETPVYRGDGPSTSSGTLTLDKAIVSFNAGDRLEKFIFNKENATLSIPQGGKDLAIACAERVGEVPLNFKASCNGQYTLSVNPENMEMDYLHLIDNMTGADIDLLALRQAQGPASYTFNAKTTDYASRFRLIFSASGDADGDNEAFAYFCDGAIIIRADVCNATLQVVDMMGRVVDSRQGDAMNRVSTSGMVPGVYVLRLLDGNDVKTQKIVIR